VFNHSNLVTFHCSCFFFSVNKFSSRNKPELNGTMKNRFGPAGYRPHWFDTENSEVFVAIISGACLRYFKSPILSIKL